MNIVEHMDIPAEVADLPIYRPSGTSLKYTSDNDVRILVWLARLCEGQIFEIGCNHGVTTFNLAVRFPKRCIKAVDWSGGATMHPDQVNQKPDTGTACMYAKWLPNVIFLDQDAQTLTVDNVGDSGLIFIDGDHSKEAVFKNTKLALDTLQTGGCIAWHDYAVTDRPSHEHWVGVNDVIGKLLNAGYRIAHVRHTILAFCFCPKGQNSSVLS